MDAEAVADAQGLVTQLREVHAQVSVHMDSERIARYYNLLCRCEALLHAALREMDTTSGAERSTRERAVQYVSAGAEVHALLYGPFAFLGETSFRRRYVNAKPYLWRLSKTVVGAARTLFTEQLREICMESSRLAMCDHGSVCNLRMHLYVNLRKILRAGAIFFAEHSVDEWSLRTGVNAQLLCSVCERMRRER